MSNKYAYNVPINGVSYGSSSIAILREIYKRGLSPCVFPIGGQIDLSAQKDDQDFNLWLQSCVNKASKYHKREDWSFRLWHISQSMESVSKKQALYCFHETDQATEEEINIINNQDVCFVSSKYTKEVFDECGAKNVIYAPLGFDDYNFYKTNKNYLNPDITTWNLIGKWELRKCTEKILKLWVKRFGNDRKYQLNCLVFNHFLTPEVNQGLVNQALEGKRIWNINFFSWLKTNAEVNDLLNAGDINIGGLSSLEGFNLPLFNSLCLGKWAVVLDAHVHKDYCNDKNSFLVPATGKTVAHDGIFFHKDVQKFNQGNWFTFDDDAAIAAFEKALEKAKERNVEGEKLKEEFSYPKMVDKILNYIG